MRSSIALPFLVALPLAGCGSDSTTPPTTTDPPAIAYPAYGSTSASSGKGSFRFGASSAATQIEDKNTATDWWLWSSPMPDGIGKGTPVGDASKGYTLALEDIDLLTAMHLDSYRFSIEWARVEPKKGMIDEDALKHYDALIDALVAKGIKPMITIHHFSNPVWVDDPRDGKCANGPTDENLCGFNHPVGGPMVVAALAAHAKMLAARYGDRVDDWCTVNEPVNYMLAAYGAATYPPGKFGLLDPLKKFVPAVKTYIDAHAAMYKAIKEADTKDADGDGVAASVGFTHGAQEWVPARNNEVSDRKEDLDARDRLMWVYQYLFVEALRQGAFDPDLNGSLDEPHPEWKGTLDWLGVQYYFRGGVTGNNGLVPVLDLTPCFGTFDGGACVPPLDPTFVVPAMGYEHDPAGLYTVLHDFSTRWPDLPMTVTESGMATDVGTRRAEMIVRALEQIEKVRAEGGDVRGYYHWSVYDNYEWSYGFAPHFGLYRVDFNSYSRTATEGATVLGEIAAARKLTVDQRKKYGGNGAMTPETASK
ncbi:MAG: family 1 glycosylhydrolase [Byssovorax sp.]